MPAHKIAVVVGSLRKESFSLKLAKALMALAPASTPQSLSFELVDIGQLPIYNQDEDEKPPQAWTDFRDKIKSFDAVLFVTPEYNRSVPGVLKNAIDVGSRPYGKSAWSGKPAGVVSNSPGAMGGFGANHHLRQSLVFLDMPTMQQPEMYVGNISKLLGPDGTPVEPATREFFSKFMAAYATWVAKHVPR